MKRSTLALLAIFGLFLACAASAYLGWENGIHSRAITRAEATGIASHLASGKLRSSRLDRSKGMPVWELNFEQPRKTNVTEICVHALTGKIVAVHSESQHTFNKELSKTAAFLGITAEHLPPVPGKAPPVTPPAEELASQKEPPERNSADRK